MRFLSLLTMVIVVAAAPAGAQVVRDKNGSFFDIAARRDALKAATAPRVRAAIEALPPCSAQAPPAPPQGRMLVPMYYLEGNHGPVNPAFAPAEAPYAAMERAVATAATRHVATGDRSEAECVLQMLGAWSDVGALLDYARKESAQAWFTVEWAAGSAALALSVARTAPGLDEARLGSVAAWLVKVAEYQLSQVSRTPTDTTNRNNHAYWRGLMATSVGVVARNDALFRLGLQTFADAVGELDEQGAWPLEMARHERALHYQSFALGPLILIAELASRQGIDLYALQARGRSIHDAVRFLVGAIADPSIVARYTPEPQYLEYLKPGSGEHAWAEFYARRYPQTSAPALLSAPLFNRRLGGGATVYAAPLH